MHFSTQREGKALFNWLSFLTYVFVTAFTPGPNNIMSMSNGSQKGFVRALPFNLGILTGFSVLSVLCALFCNVVGEWIPLIKTPMVIVGAVYMLYLAWGTLRSSGEIEEPQKGKGGYISAVFLQCVNPKLYLYCIVSMEAYILPVFQGNIPVLIVFAVLLAFVGFCSTLIWSAFGSGFKRLFSAHTKVVNTIMALLLVYCALSLFLS